LVIDYRLILLGFLSYLAGGIPSGYIVARRLKGIDIREHGSGNPGAANVYRIVGFGAGWATMIFDALKGYLPVLLAGRVFPGLWPAIACGALAIVGHVWTPFLGFRGGKGVATSSGVFLALMPAPMLFSVAAFVLATALTKHISAGSMCGALTLPVAAFAVGEPRPLALMSVAVSALILVRHTSNFKRLLRGKEAAFGAANGKQTHPPEASRHTRSSTPR
jgi:glycerol-3-phosphate acyltransferase PlsY